LANFESGVADYIRTYAVVEVNFPVDFRGNADISCMQCKFFSRNNGICQLTKSIVAYPNKFTGQDCPLIKKEE